MGVVGAKLAEHEDVARRCKILANIIRTYQDSITTLEKVSKAFKYLLLFLHIVIY